MTMAYDYEPERDEAAPNGDCICKQYANNGRYIDPETGEERFCWCPKGMALQFHRRDYLRKREEK